MKNIDIKTHSIKYNFFMNVILKGSSFLFPLITLPYVARTLGAKANGRITFATAVISYFLMIANVGIPTYGIRACAKLRDDKKNLSKTVIEILSLEYFMTFIAYIVLGISIYSINRFKVDAKLIWISSIALILSTMGAEWLFNALEQFEYIAIRNIIFKLLSLGMMFIFVHNYKDVYVYAGIIILGTYGSNIMNVIQLRKYIDFMKIGIKDMAKHVKPAFTFFFLSIAISIYTNLDNVMLGFMTSDADVGYYSVAVKVRGIILTVVTALCTVLLPRVSYYFENNKLDDFKRIICKSIYCILLLAVPFMVFFIVVSQQTVSILAGDKFGAAVLPLCFIMPTVLFAGLSNLTGIQVLVPMGLEKYTVISTICGALVDLIINIVLIPHLGTIGAAIGTMFAELIVLIIQVMYLRNRIKFNIDIRNILKIIIASIISMSILLLVKPLIFVASSFINFIVCALVFFIPYSAILIVTGETICSEYVINSIQCKLKGKKGWRL